MLISQINTFTKKFIVDEQTGCWVWQRHPVGGYGNHTVNGKEQRAHRVAYSLVYGEIPAGLVVDHLCRNKLCVNPKHLEAVTQRENILRGISPQAIFAKRTHCDKGHSFSSDNTIIRENGGRRCAKCHKEYHRLYRLSNRDKLNQQMREYRNTPEGKEKQRISRDKWYAMNRVKMLEYYKEYNAKRRKTGTRLAENQA